MQKSAGCRSHLDRTLSAACQHDSHPPTRTSVRASLGSGSGVVPYNSRTTRRAPTGSHQRIRQRCSRAPKRLVIRKNADRRSPAPPGVGALITRRSQVQILPPPPIAPGQGPFPRDREGPLTLQSACSYNTSSTDRGSVRETVQLVAGALLRPESGARKAARVPKGVRWRRGGLTR